MTTTTQKGPIYQMVEKRMDEIQKFRNSMGFDDVEGRLSQEHRFVELRGLLKKIQELEPVFIPVEERLPEVGQPVVVFNGTVRLGELDSYEKTRFYELCDGEWFGVEPTHWQPLPQSLK